MTMRLAHSCTIVQTTILEGIIDEAFAIITNNQFVRQHLSSYILKRQETIFTDATLQTEFIPNHSINIPDKEASPLKDDSLMAVTELQPNKNQNNQKNVITSSKLSGAYSKKSSIEQIKVRMTTQRPTGQQYKSITEELPKSSHNNQHQQNVGDMEYISKLRMFKEQQERNRLSKPLTEVRKMKPKPLKGQRIVFDYDGQFQKGKELKNPQFEQNVMNTSIQMEDEQNKNKKELNKQIEPTTILTKLHDRSIKNKSDIRRQFEFTGQQKRQLILNSLRLADIKTKIVFDGHSVTKQEETVNDSLKTELVVPLRKRSSLKQPTFPTTQLNQQETQRVKSDVFQMQMEVSRSLKAKDDKKHSRVITEATGSAKKQRINIQSQSLKKVLMTEVDEDSHFQLPKNRVQRAITNITAASSCNDPDLIKIKERLNIKLSSDRLPKILSRYSNLEKEILREIRKKSKV